MKNTKGICGAGYHILIEVSPTVLIFYVGPTPLLDMVLGTTGAYHFDFL